MFKYLLLSIICFVSLFAQAKADWRYLTADKTFEYRFDTEQVLAVFPFAYVELKLVPVNLKEFRKSLPKTFASTATAAGISVRADCAFTDTAQFTKWSAYDAKDKRRIITAKGVPNFIDMEKIGTALKYRICKQWSGIRPEYRWDLVGKVGKEFGEYTSYVDSESLTKDYYINFWWRLQPKYPVMFAVDRDLFERFNDVEDFGYVQIKSKADCRERTLIWGELNYYSKDGAKLKSLDGSKSESVEPESVEEDLLKFVCSKYGNIK